MPISAKAKGYKGEVEAKAKFAFAMNQVETELLREGFTFPAGRPSLAVKRNMEQNAGAHDIVGIPFIALEVKRHEREDVATWWRQTVKNAEKAAAEPVLVWRATRRPWSCRTRGYVALNGEWLSLDVDYPLDEYLTLYAKAYRKYLTVGKG